MKVSLQINKNYEMAKSYMFTPVTFMVEKRSDQMASLCIQMNTSKETLIIKISNLVQCSHQAI